MPKYEVSPGQPVFDKVLLSLDGGVFGAAYRVLIGFVTVPTKQFLLGNDSSDWVLVPFLLLVLVLFRIFPAIVRKMIPFSAVLKEDWSVRRRTAKLYDSYQWRKLMWIGAGLALWVVFSRQYSSTQIALSIFCLVAGIVATFRWRAIAGDGKYPKPVARNVQRVV